MESLTFLSRWIEDPDPSILSDAALRLARHVPEAQSVLGGLLADPIQRALAGLGDVDPTACASLSDRVRAAIACGEGGVAVDAGWLAALEAEAKDADPTLWPLAARAAVLLDEGREQAARMALSIQDLPYAFPGDVNAVQVDVFSAGDRVLPALHVDWARKLTGLACEALVTDLRSMGLWAWPALQVMEPRQLTRTLKKILRRPRRIPPGGVGLAAAYLEQVGGSPGGTLSGADGFILDLARATRKRTHR